MEACRALRRLVEEIPALEGKAETRVFVEALESEIAQAEDACAALLTSLHAMGTRANAFADGMQFGFLFDTKRELFSIGYNVGAGRLDGSHYDLLASEARLASVFAIAKGDVPQTHWWRLARTRTTAASRDVLISWSGSMFEYLMPFLVTENPPGTLLYETSRTAVRRQVEYGRQRNVPWGVSESAYNLLDFGMTYQYRAFGVPGLGLKSGLGEDLVIAPYATGLAALVEPRLAVANLAALSREGAEGPYGYYEAIDYTPARTPPGRPHVIVKAYMAHHQGMMLVALEEVLCDGMMRRRFHRDPRIKATELLLEERVPARSHIVKPKPSHLPSRVSEPDLDAVEYVGLGSNVRAHLLGHGELSTLITSMGDGFTMWRGIDVNRFREDPSLGSGGTYIYVRERGAGRVWSSGYQPTRMEPDFYEVAFANDKVELRRRDGDVETNTEIVASPEHPVEIRRVTLRNRGLWPVTLDVTTYTEIVLAPRAADVAHRAFSNMFVATEALPERGALLAMRRPRSASEPERWVVQILMPGRGEWGALGFECSRSTFLGREGSMERPVGIASDAELGRGVGMVLDP
ncbi:MAG: carbohydrate-binding protein, partial [Myxococcales bacterium]|nr:carbohydrate-binding protein [Myxococcales bacterium]